MRRWYFDSEERRWRLYSQLETWANTPFAHGYCIRRVGVDCVQLVGAVMQACGVVDDYDFGEYSLDYGHHAEDSLITAHIEKTGRFERVSAPGLPGDLVCFTMGKCVQHIGIFTYQHNFIHAVRRIGVKTSRITDSTWSKRLAATYRAKV
jgi:cell wall-associated NlpC family hydrolase